jgi:hypothetical protein
MSDRLRSVSDRASRSVFESPTIHGSESVFLASCELASADRSSSAVMSVTVLERSPTQPNTILVLQEAHRYIVQCCKRYTNIIGKTSECDSHVCGLPDHFARPHAVAPAFAGALAMSSEKLRELPKPAISQRVMTSDHQPRSRLRWAPRLPALGPAGGSDEAARMGFRLRVARV